MAKRFIDTNILKHHFLRGLEAPLKLLWMHLLTDCNHAGVWQVDFEIAEIIIGTKIDPKKVAQVFKEKVIILKGGKQWFIPAFIEFQYGKLQEKNPAHKNVILILKKEFLINENLEVLPSPLIAPSKGTKEKEEVKETEKEKEEVKEKEKPPPKEKTDINSRMIQAWYEYHVKLKGLKPSAFSGQDAAAIKKIRERIITLIPEKTDDKILEFWKIILENLPQKNQWLSTQPLSVINSHFDTAITNIKNGKSKSGWNTPEELAAAAANIDWNN